MIWPEFFLVASIHLLAVMSPGPDFVMISRSALVYSRRSGLFSAAGLGLGILVHVAYSLVGIAVLISQSIILFNAIKYIGAAYLVYIGIKSLRAKSKNAHLPARRPDRDLSALASLRLGFFTNVFNPKATLFFLALFTQIIDSTTPLWVQIIYGVEMSLATAAWFSVVVLLLTQNHVKRGFRRIQHRAEQVFGGLLIALGVKIALSSK
ncbi:hypothetical protein CSA80_01070 [Candidatus Saccharibacteria bacterium]|nr:MAG: hypothetical protein CR973_02085 [Candidatus Saccharibacteria bacterium]PID99341.1 MAG: hypothetical protein CSA80_01070 [Candidatus Saccharibacteria bacterium]